MILLFGFFPQFPLMSHLFINPSCRDTRVAAIVMRFIHIRVQPMVPVRPRTVPEEVSSWLALTCHYHFGAGTWCRGDIVTFVSDTADALTRRDVGGEQLLWCQVWLSHHELRIGNGRGIQGWKAQDGSHSLWSHWMKHAVIFLEGGCHWADTVIVLHFITLLFYKTSMH